jgi:hypothetical protein
MKQFTIAGTSTLNDVNTYRFATGKLSIRVAKLKRHGHSDVCLFELPTPMTKKEAVAWLADQGITAVIPVTGRGAKKPVELTPEQAAASAQRKQRAAEIAASDAEYVQGLTGAAAPVVASDTPPVASNDDAVTESVEELMAAVDHELGVDADRAAAEVTE